MATTTPRVDRRALVATAREGGMGSEGEEEGVDPGQIPGVAALALALATDGRDHVVEIGDAAHPLADARPLADLATTTGGSTGEEGIAIVATTGGIMIGEGGMMMMIAEG